MTFLVAALVNFSLDLAFQVRATFGQIPPDSFGKTVPVAPKRFAQLCFSFELNRDEM